MPHLIRHALIGATLGLVGTLWAPAILARAIQITAALMP
jgi:hypothetical protein